VGALNSPHILGTLVPVEEPSTASLPDMQVHAAACPQMGDSASTKSGYVSISFMKMNRTR
jgi:hypothetical protein